MLIRFSPEADAELTEAREWYSHQRKDLIWNSCNVSKSRCYPDEIEIIAVFHSRCNPDVWRSRVS